MSFNAEEYWAAKPSKVWVVTLKRNRRSTGKDVDRKIVRAKERAGAIKTAKYYSFITGAIATDCRLATPTDLGCVETPEGGRTL